MTQPRLTKLQRLLNSAKLVRSLVVSDEPHWHATLSIFGLSTESFDKQGNPKTTSVMSHAGFSRIYSLNLPHDESGHTFLDWATLTKDAMMFISSTRLIFGRSMYDIGVSKSVFDCKTSLGYLGNSSVALVTDLTIPGNPEPIFKQMNQSVCIDRAIRRPQPLPDWFKDKYKGKGILEKGVIVKPLEKPDDTFVYEIKVAWSDTDFYNHTNYASYVTFGINAIHAALRDDAKTSTSSDVDTAKGEETSSSDTVSSLKGLTSDIVGRGVKSVDICYIKESLEGQLLEAHVWQDEGTPYVVKCAIESKGHDICHMTFEYFDET